MLETMTAVELFGELTLRNRKIYKCVGITEIMHFKNKNIKGKRYRYAAKSIRLPSGKNISLEMLYKGQSEQELKKSLEKKEKGAHLTYALTTYRTDSIFTAEEFEKIEDIKFGYRKILKKLSKTSLKDLFDRFTANFTYESNALEGNSLTLKDVAIVLFENATLKGKDLREIYETRNSREVVELIIKNKFSIDQKSIIKMHKMLVRDTGIRKGYKVVPNIILGREIQTIPPERVKKEMDKLIEWYEHHKKTMHPLKIAALFHGKFEQIHPFEDGNGRVGRFLINVILIGSKYPPLIIRKSQRISYLGALEQFDKEHSLKLERFLLERFKETYRKFFEVYVQYV